MGDSSGNGTFRAPWTKKEQSRSKLIAVANDVVSGNIDLIDGVRQICNLRFAVADPDDEIFLPLRGVESETEEFPGGNERQLWSADALARFDQRKKNIWRCPR